VRSDVATGCAAVLLGLVSLGLVSLGFVALSFVPASAAAADTIVVGSKAFTEGYVLGEIAAQTIESASTVPVTRKLGMGSTGILFEALKSGAIDVYRITPARSPKPSSSVRT
jgi:osmoprotectant transport system permease protein